MSQRNTQNRPADWPDWFEPKGYPHFDQPLRGPEQVRGLIESPTAVARHSFLPFIHFVKSVRKYKREEQRFVQKTRPLSYASHTDTQVFRRYCLMLSTHYEEYLAKLGLGDAVLAYRRFDPPRCNIHFANEVFRFIETNAPCVAMAFDVKDFFESLSHKQLKCRWKEVMNVGELPPDHYAVFKAVTKYAWVDRDEVYNVFGVTKKKLKNWRHPLCTPAQFRSQVRTENQAAGLVKVNVRSCGVPQGSAISALLSNIYMTTVDQAMSAAAQRCGGLYRRYSDDILLVCKEEHRGPFEAELRRMMKACDLEMHDGPGKFMVSSYDLAASGALTADRPLQYLGFTFDGQNVRVRSQTVARYMRKMQKAVRREKWVAQSQAAVGGKPCARRKLLYSRYSHLGTKNFISYCKKARAEFLRNKIREQVRRHWTVLHASLRFE